MTSKTLPLVSFLVPCFNYAQYLKECIDSIGAQSFQNFEILILDDASTDETPEQAQALAALDPRIRYYRHETNIGHLLNYNFGIDQAQGDLIWLISADDALAKPDILQEFVQRFETNPKLGFAFCRVQCMDEHSQPYDKFIPNPNGVSLPGQGSWFHGPVLFKKLIQANFIPAPATIARKACYQQYGQFSTTLTHSGDWFNWLKFCLDWDVWFESEAKVYYRKHQQNMHLTYQRPRHALENSLLCYQEMEAFLKAHAYSKTLINQCRLARLQFMHKNGFPLSPLQKLSRLYLRKFGAELSTHSV